MAKGTREAVGRAAKKWQALTAIFRGHKKGRVLLQYEFLKLSSACATNALYDIEGHGTTICSANLPFIVQVLQHIS